MYILYRKDTSSKWLRVSVGMGVYKYCSVCICVSVCLCCIFFKTYPLCVSAPSSFIYDLAGPELALYRDIFDMRYDPLCFYLSVLQMKGLFEF